MTGTFSPLVVSPSYAQNTDLLKKALDDSNLSREELKELLIEVVQHNKESKETLKKIYSDKLAKFGAIAGICGAIATVCGVIVTFYGMNSGSRADLLLEDIQLSLGNISLQLETLSDSQIEEISHLESIQKEFESMQKNIIQLQEN